MSQKPVGRAKRRAHFEHTFIEHDAWNPSPPKLPRASPIELGEI